MFVKVFFGAQSLAFSRCGWNTRFSPQSCDIRVERVCHAFVFRTLDTEVDLRRTVCVDRTCQVRLERAHLLLGRAQFCVVRSDHTSKKRFRCIGHCDQCLFSHLING